MVLWGRTFRRSGAIFFPVNHFQLSLDSDRNHVVILFLILSNDHRQDLLCLMGRVDSFFLSSKLQNPSSVFSHSSVLFHFPYPATLLFATLTKTTGVYTNNSHSGTCAISFSLSFFVSRSCRLFSRQLSTTAPASLFLSVAYKLFAVTTGVAYHDIFSTSKMNQTTDKPNSINDSLSRHPISSTRGRVSPRPRFASHPYSFLLNYIVPNLHRAGPAGHVPHSAQRPRS
jgi:hypothetical protein